MNRNAARKARRHTKMIETLREAIIRELDDPEWAQNAIVGVEKFATKTDRMRTYRAVLGGAEVHAAISLPKNNCCTVCIMYVDWQGQRSYPHSWHHIYDF